MSGFVECADLIGRPFVWGEFDCIHLVYEVLGRMQIPTPPFNPYWYEASRISIARDLLGWGKRISYPTYDGDVVLLPTEQLAFAVVWQTGILYMNRQVEAVSWCPTNRMPVSYALRCFRLSAS